MTHFLFSQFAILDISGRLLWLVLGHEKFCLRLLRLLLKFVPFCERHSFLCIVAVYMLMEERSIHIIILTLQYFITDSKLSHVFNWWFLLAKMEPMTKLLDKNLSQLRYEETVTRGCFWPLSCRSAILGYSIMLLERNLWSYQLPSNRFSMPDQVTFAPRLSCVRTYKKEVFFGSKSYQEKLNVDVQVSGKRKKRVLRFQSK